MRCFLPSPRCAALSASLMSILGTFACQPAEAVPASRQPDGSEQAPGAGGARAGSESAASGFLAEGPADGGGAGSEGPALSPAEEPPPEPRADAGAPPPDAGLVELPPAGLVGTPSRPQLSPAQAPSFSMRSYLASAGSLEDGLVRDDWDPAEAIEPLDDLTPDFVVAAEGGTHTTVQQAIDAAIAAGGEGRRYVEVRPGTYREVVCVPSGAPPLTLFGSGAAPEETVIVFDNYSGKPKPPGTPANPCNPNADSATFGTSGSATFAAYARGFVARNLTISNDTDESTAEGGVQGVALITQGDRLVFEGVRVLGNQDTLYVKSPNTSRVVRAYFKNCYVEGDTDFVFGRGTFVLDGCTLHSLTSRTGSGVVLAPSTDARNARGILVIDSMFTADAAAEQGSTALGRAWDEGQGDEQQYALNVQTGVYPNGQALITRSFLGAHIAPLAPWRPAATTSRAFSSTAGSLPANRLYEFDNTGPGAPSP